MNLAQQMQAVALVDDADDDEEGYSEADDEEDEDYVVEEQKKSTPMRGSQASGMPPKMITRSDLRKQGGQGFGTL